MPLSTLYVIYETNKIDAPQIFGAVGIGANDKLFITGFFGVVKVVACGIFVLFLVERIGRKWSLAIGAFLMGSLMLIVAMLAKSFPADPDSTAEATGISSHTAASIAMIYLEAAAYNMSWVLPLFLRISSGSSD